jgi:hypothetical protein
MSVVRLNQAVLPSVRTGDAPASTHSLSGTFARHASTR